MGYKITKKLKLKKLSLKTSVGKKKITVKVKINRKIKNQVVKVKANSKTFKIRTNSKGIAKLAVKKAKTLKLRQAIKITQFQKKLNCEH